MLRHVVRRPLPWLLAAEAVVLLALGLAGWRLVSDRLAPPPPAGLASLPLPPAAVAPSARPSPPATATPAPSRPAAAGTGPPPGLATSPAFWQRNLTQLNRDEASWEAVEARAMQAVEDFTRAYLQQVVLPAVKAAADSGQRR